MQGPKQPTGRNSHPPHSTSWYTHASPTPASQHVRHALLLQYWLGWFLPQCRHIGVCVARGGSRPARCISALWRFLSCQARPLPFLPPPLPPCSAASTLRAAASILAAAASILAARSSEGSAGESGADAEAAFGAEAETACGAEAEAAEAFGSAVLSQRCNAVGGSAFGAGRGGIGVAGVPWLE